MAQARRRAEGRECVGRHRRAPLRQGGIKVVPRLPDDRRQAAGPTAHRVAAILGWGSCVFFAVEWPLDRTRWMLPLYKPVSSDVRMDAARA